MRVPGFVTHIYPIVDSAPQADIVLRQSVIYLTTPQLSDSEPSSPLRQPPLSRWIIAWFKLLITTNVSCSSSICLYYTSLGDQRQ